MTVRAKFYVSGKQGDAATGYTISLLPVTSGSEENQNFYKWTPNGSCSLSTINEQAAEEFEIGAEFYLDFTRAK